jgi:hypothetical protein
MRKLCDLFGCFEQFQRSTHTRHLMERHSPAGCAQKSHFQVLHVVALPVVLLMMTMMTTKIMMLLWIPPTTTCNGTTRKQEQAFQTPQPTARNLLLVFVIPSEHRDNWMWCHRKKDKLAKPSRNHFNFKSPPPPSQIHCTTKLIRKQPIQFPTLFVPKQSFYGQCQTGVKQAFSHPLVHIKQKHQTSGKAKHQPMQRKHASETLPVHIKRVHSFSHSVDHEAGGGPLVAPVDMTREHWD